MDRRRTYLYLIPAAVWGFLLGGLSMAIGVYARSQADKPIQGISVDPDNTVCYMFDMGPAWHLISEKNRQKVGRLIAEGKADFLEAQTLTCVHKLGDSQFGTKVYLRQEWYRERKK